MPPYRPIHIALTFTDSFWAMAYTVMRSICLSTRQRKDVVFHLIHSPLSTGHAAVLEGIEKEFGASLRHYDPVQNRHFSELVDRLPRRERFPPIVYARLSLDKFLPEGTGRVIYLDCDTLVRRPIEELFDLDLGGFPIAAVADPYHDGLKRGRDIRDKASPFDTADPYFNSGVMLIDLDALAAADIPAALEDLSQSGLLGELYYDQDILNFIFRGRWLELPWRFNLMLPRKAHEGLGATVLHYTGVQSPWNLFSGAAFHRTYRHVMTNAVFYRFWRERQKRRWLGPLRRLIGRGKAK